MSVRSLSLSPAFSASSHLSREVDSDSGSPRACLSICSASLAEESRGGELSPSLRTDSPDADGSCNELDALCNFIEGGSSRARTSPIALTYQGGARVRVEAQPLSKPCEVTRDPAGFMNLVEGEGLSEKLLISRRIFSMKDYWMLMVQKGVHLGVSLAPLSDRSPDYYPLDMGEWRISYCDVSRDKQLLRRDFELTHLSTGESRIFIHFTLDWENLGLPQVDSFLQLMRNYLEQIGSLESPLVHLHCEGGHGRSGTFLLARALICQPERSCAAELLSRLRKQRDKLVESRKQFEFAVTQAQVLSRKSFELGDFQFPPTPYWLEGDRGSCFSFLPPSNPLKPSSYNGYTSASASSSFTPLPEPPIKTRVMEQVRKNGMFLRLASKELQDDREVVLEAISQNPKAFQFASPRLRDCDSLVYQAVWKWGKLLEFASPRLAGDEMTALAAVSQCGLALRFVSAELKKSRPIVFAAIKEDGSALQLADNTFKSDLDLVTQAVKKSWVALQYAAPHLLNDNAILTLALSQDGRALRYADLQARSNKDLVLMAVARCGMALQWADPLLVDDTEVVETAIADDGCAIRFASARLKADRVIAFQAVEQNRNALQYISPALREEWREMHLSK